MRYLSKDVGGKWQKDMPEDPLRWLWKHDGAEAVAVDDDTNTYYCATPEMADTYREAWVKEGKKGDKRIAAMFIDLAPLVHNPLTS
jgi:hypothetical protein